MNMQLHVIQNYCGLMVTLVHISYIALHFLFGHAA